MSENIFERIPYYFFLLAVLILPIWLLPYTSFPLEFNKAFLFYVFTIAAAIFWFISILQKASFRIPKSAALLAFLTVIAVWLVSSFFSPNSNLSLFGAGYEVGTFFSLAFLGVALLLVSVAFQSEAKAMKFYLALFTSSLLVFIFQLFHSGFNITLLPWNIFASKTANTIGSWNEVGIFFGLTALLSVVFLELFNLGKFSKLLFFVTFIASLAGAALVNFTTVWIVLGSFLIVFLVYLFSMRLASSAEGATQIKFMRLTIITLLVVFFFIIAKVLVGDFISSLGISSIEVKPALSATWQVIKGSLTENILLGSGPNTFVYDWLRFKPADINLTIFWSFPFQAGVGLLPTFIATTGILGGAAWLAFLLFLLFYGLKAVTYFESEVNRGLLIASFLGSLYLWSFTIVYSPGFLITALAFLVTGVFIALLCRSGKIKTIEISFLNKPKLGFICSLIIVLLMIASVASLYFLFQKYWAAYSFSRGVDIINSSGQIDEGEKMISRAANFDPQDRYFRSLSDIGLLRIQQLASRTDLSADDLRIQFQNTLAAAIGNAQKAVTLNPLDFLNWMSLGGIYESVIPFKITGAGDASVSAYKEASSRAPQDPRPMLAAARVEIQNNNLKEARSFLDSAINAKSDYAPALFLLSQIEAQEGNIKESIRRAEQTFSLAPNDIGVLFQLGLLYYRDKNFDNSQLALERVVSLNPNYSNARYFLGLIYDRAGKNKDAIEQFRKIQQLNPDNQEVKKILSNLNSGKPALNNISPPAPSPEKRSEVPLNEANPEK